MARWENDDWVVRSPIEQTVICKDCVFREEDRVYKGEVVYKGACLGTCKCYPMSKPAGILYRGEDCDFYVSENDPSFEQPQS